MHRLLVGGELLLYGDVGDMWGDGSGFSARDVIEALAIHGDADLTVRINSGGGFVKDGVSIYNSLKAHKGKVTTTNDGIAASAASVIFLAGEERIAKTGSLLMIHDPSSVTWGNAKDHEATAKVLNKIGDQIARLYAEATGESEASMREAMLAETWMDELEAETFGFATKTENVAATAATRFDYTAYAKAPENLRAAQRALPEAKAVVSPAAPPAPAGAKPAATAALPAPVITPEPQDMKNASAILALCSAASLTLAQGSDILAKANDSVETAQSLVDGIVAARNAKPDQSREILARCTAAKLSLEATNEIVTKADGDLTAALNLIIDAVATAKEPNPGQTSTPAVVTADARDKFNEGVEKALLGKVGAAGGERNEFTGMTLREIARESLTMSGQSARFNDPMTMVAAALGMPIRGITMSNAGQSSTSDFVQVLANVANKSMLKGFEETGETFDQWTARGTLVDFKPAKRVDLNLFPSLAQVDEGGEYTYGTIGDRGESIQLATYGKMFSITRQAIINDDMSVFTRVPSRMGRAAKRTIGNLAWAVLTDNAAMSDAVALFHATHKNLAGTPSALSVNSLDAARSAMALQQDPDGLAVALNIAPKWLLVPVALQGVAKTLMSAEKDPLATNANSSKPNHVRDMATVIADARLDRNSATAWYLATDANAHDTIEVAYLNGQSEPVMEQKEGWNVDGVEFKVRIDAGVKALDFRGLYKNAGV